MSAEEWEDGGFKLSCAEYNKFKKSFKMSYNTLIDKVLIVANTVYLKTIEEGKGKRNFDWLASAGRNANADKLSNIFYHEIIKSMFPEGASKRPVKPKKKDFPKAASKTNSFEAGNAEITFSDDSKSVGWRVEPSDRGVRMSWEHPVGIMFSNSLKNVVWCRNTGGSIFGGDDYDDGGVADISLKYGVLGEKDDLNLRNARLALAGFPPIKKIKGRTK